MRVPLAYQEVGDGPPLIILHGLFGSARNWQSLARRFAESYRVFAVDLRNHGDSRWAPTMSFPEMADDLAAFFVARGLRDAIVLGHSLGGKTAMLFALMHAAMVDALIVVDIAPVAYDHTFLPMVEAMRALDLGRFERRAEAEAALAPAIADEATRAFIGQNLIAGEAGLTWRINLRAIAEHMRDLTGFPHVAGLDYDGRALFISGADSDYVGPGTQAAVFELFPQAEFAVIADAGHRVHADQPDRFFARVVDFLDSAYA